MSGFNGPQSDGSASDRATAPAGAGIRSFILKRIEKKAKLPGDADLRQFDYIETGYVDSIGIIKFVMEIEAEFDVAIEDDEMLSCGFRTVEGVIALVESKLRST